MTDEGKRQPRPKLTEAIPLPKPPAASRPVPLQPKTACAEGDDLIDDGSDPCPPGVKSGRGA